MIQIYKYLCEECGEEFASMQDCLDHEKEHKDETKLSGIPKLIIDQIPEEEMEDMVIDTQLELACNWGTDWRKGINKEFPILIRLVEDDSDIVMSLTINQAEELSDRLFDVLQYYYEYNEY